MNEREFLQTLQQRAAEQEQAMQSIPFFAFVVKWLSRHPWRYLIPLAFFLTLLLRWIFGDNYTDAILYLFRANSLLPTP
ncbi:MAG TPA: hypothetical protein VLF20_02650 [Patescibacteria group bacterium]|nr:hypothetical protein [Patescibacteria group bacterium]